MSTKPKRIKEARAPYRAKRRTSAAKSSAEKVTLRWVDVENAVAPIILEKNGEPVAVVVKYANWIAATAPEESGASNAEAAKRRERILGYAGMWKDLPLEVWTALKAEIERRTEFFAERSLSW